MTHNLGPKPTCIGVIDCNNFFASCERIFRPDLVRKPILVLSNNDGCVVARSNEARLLNIKIGQPVFQLKNLIKLHQIKIFSGNFPLYNNISNRVMQLIKNSCPQVEIYSIDEAFVDLSTLQISDRLPTMLKLRQQIWQEIGLPASIGLATTKTLAKLANELVKSLDRNEIVSDINWPNQANGGVLDLSSLANLTSYRKAVAVEAVWGIGAGTAPKLRLKGINTADDLANWSKTQVVASLRLPGQQTWLELNDQCCWPLHQPVSQNQTLMISRTFGQSITEFSSLASAISQFAEKLSEKLRHQHQLAKNLTVFVVWKNRDSTTSATLKLNQPSQLATQLVEAAIKTLRLCLHDSQKPAIKAGVIISDLISELSLQPNLFTDRLEATALKSQGLAQLAMDRLNFKFGPQTIQVARSIRPNQAADWRSLQTAKSPDYVTSWADLAKVS